MFKTATPEIAWCPVSHSYHFPSETLQLTPGVYHRPFYPSTNFPSPWPKHRWDTSVWKRHLEGAFYCHKYGEKSSPISHLCVNICHSTYVVGWNGHIDNLAWSPWNWGGDYRRKTSRFCVLVLFPPALLSRVYPASVLVHTNQTLHTTRFLNRLQLCETWKSYNESHVTYSSLNRPSP